MSSLLSTAIVHLAAPVAEEGANHALSYGVGGIALALLLTLMGGLLMFGGGREHS